MRSVKNVRLGSVVAGAVVLMVLGSAPAVANNGVAAKKFSVAYVSSTGQRLTGQIAFAASGQAVTVKVGAASATGTYAVTGLPVSRQVTAKGLPASFPFQSFTALVVDPSVYTGIPIAGFPTIAGVGTGKVSGKLVYYPFFGRIAP